MGVEDVSNLLKATDLLKKYQDKIYKLLNIVRSAFYWQNLSF